MINKIYKLITFFTILILFSNSAFAFTDVSTDHKNYDAINYLFENEIIQGYEDNTFAPERTVSRAEALKIILLSADIDTENTDYDIDLLDIDENSWFTSYVKKALELGIVQGYSDNKFYPEKDVNLAEGLKITIESLGINSDKFEVDQNADPENWYDPYLIIAQQNNIFKNIENLKLSKKLTRGDIAQIIYMILNPDKIPEDENYFVAYEADYVDPDEHSANYDEYAVGSFKICRATYYGYAFAGNNTASGEVYDPEKLTAAHKELPFNTMVRVTNLANDKYIVVRINDRGPFTEGLEIDLSQAAFEDIAALACGVLDVKMEILE